MSSDTLAYIGMTVMFVGWMTVITYIIVTTLKDNPTT